MTTLKVSELLSKLKEIPGGYEYIGACSYQICFPLKSGGELRFSIVDDDVCEGEPFGIDLYGGEMPPMITGFGKATAQTTEEEGGYNTVDEGDEFQDAEDCWVGGDIDEWMNTCHCGKYPSEGYPNGACHVHGTCAGGPDCNGTCL